MMMYIGGGVAGVVLLLIIISLAVSKKEGLSYSSKEKFTNDFQIPKVMMLQASASQRNPFVGALPDEQ